MKRVLLILLGCLLGISLLAQEDKARQLKETKVEPPRFEKPMEYEEVEIIKPSPICYYIQEELIYPEVTGGYQNEGIVGVEFTVEPDGTLSNFIVTNPVSPELDWAVIECLKGTDDLWIPGKVNGKNASMQKLVYVKFDVLGNPTHTEMAMHFYLSGTDIYQRALARTDEHSTRANRKAKRGFKRTMNALDQALRYSPEDPSVIFWQAATYGQQGNQDMMNKKLDRYLEIINATGFQRVPEEELEIAVITRTK